ncbi:hypothetical protein [uncultured Paraglaciecola sp.]|uniref:hypothetical protein n=1 Tax=uncultured Paraglaciecola sp. TaxID=1765024 RepID=UPI0030DD96EA|tara:strand:+ start:6900 stop:7277 length:378 start_codon:yes stop_codon:yes gene_type:complete
MSANASGGSKKNVISASIITAAVLSTLLTISENIDPNSALKAYLTKVNLSLLSSFISILVTYIFSFTAFYIHTALHEMKYSRKARVIETLIESCDSPSDKAEFESQLLETKKQLASSVIHEKPLN